MLGHIGLPEKTGSTLGMDDGPYFAAANEYAVSNCI